MGSYVPKIELCDAGELSRPCKTLILLTEYIETLSVHHVAMIRNDTLLFYSGALPDSEA